MKKQIFRNRKNTYRIGMNEENLYTIEKWLGFDDDFNDVWSKEWLLAPWEPSVIKAIMKYADNNGWIGYNG